MDDLAKTLEAFNVIETLSDSADHIIPGHDPHVSRRFPHWNDDPHIVCLHEEPLHSAPDWQAVVDGKADCCFAASSTSDKEKIN